MPTKPASTKTSPPGGAQALVAIVKSAAEPLSQGGADPGPGRAQPAGSLGPGQGQVCRIGWWGWAAPRERVVRAVVGVGGAQPLALLRQPGREQPFCGESRGFQQEVLGAQPVPAVGAQEALAPAAPVLPADTPAPRGQEGRNSRGGVY